MDLTAGVQRLPGWARTPACSTSVSLPRRVLALPDLDAAEALA